MRLTALAAGRVRGAGRAIPAPQTAHGTSIPAQIGGWDAFSPIAAMPPENALQLINWFPQPGWVELRKGHLIHADTGTGEPIDTLMAYQGQNPSTNKMFGASDSEIFDVTTSVSSSVVSGLSNNRWQWVNFATSGGTFLWLCNGEDTPRYYNGSTWNTAVITGTTPEDMIAVTLYRSRIWTVLKNSTKAAYLPLDSIQGAAVEFDLGGYFSQGGHLQAIATWSTDVQGGTNEFIVFISSYGEAAIFLIYDPTSASGFSFRGVATIGPPIGTRCWDRVGSDAAIITLDGVLPLSQIINYDRAALANASLTNKIRAAMSQAAKDFKDNFGWQIITYPRSTMVVLNVPVSEGAIQQQFVMNSITGAWCRFEGQNANCWTLFEDRLYFGGNDGVVRIADAAAGDEDQTLEADIQGAYNYYGLRGQNKRWTSLRPLITKDDAFVLDLDVGLSIDFELNNALDDVLSDGLTELPIWDDPNTLWNEAVWPGEVTTQRWLAVSGIGYCAAIRMKASVPWSENLIAPLTLKVNSFDVLYDVGAFI